MKKNILPHILSFFRTKSKTKVVQKVNFGMQKNTTYEGKNNQARKLILITSLLEYSKRENGTIALEPIRSKDSSN